MKRIELSIVLLAALILTPGGGDAKADDKMKAKPNVLILLTDDQRGDTIAALGNPDIITPNLDAIARRGTNVPNTYCLGANMGAVCRPSRNMVLSGRTYFRWSHPTDGRRPQRNAPQADNTLPAAFNAAGYETYHHGKRGNTAENIHKQFDHSHYLRDFDDRWAMQAGKKVVDDAIEFLDDRDASSPFLMYLAFATPHDPRAASVEALKQYNVDDLKLPANRLDAHPFDNGSVLGRDEWTSLWPRSDRRLRTHYHDYYACITTIDHHIGRLIGQLDDAGQLENTIVVFTSDHGLAMGSHGLMGKQNVYEAGYKPPMVIAGPGIPAGRTDDLAYLMDLHPTLCDLSGVAIPDGLDGESFADSIRGDDDATKRDAIMLAYTDSQRAIRSGDWKLIRYPLIDRTQLFDLSNDPTEMNDLAGRDEHSERIASLMMELRELQKDAGDDLALTSDQYTADDYPVPAIRPVSNEAFDPQKHGSIHSTVMVGPTSDTNANAAEMPVNKSRRPFQIQLAEGERFTAMAIGTDRDDASVVTAIRFDIIDASGSDLSRRTVVAGDLEARFAPLADLMRPNSQPVGLFGRHGDVIHSMGIIEGDDKRRVPAFGGKGGHRAFEIRIAADGGDAKSISDKLAGFHGTTVETEDGMAIESIGILYR